LSFFFFRARAAELLGAAMPVARALLHNCPAGGVRRPPPPPGRGLWARGWGAALRRRSFADRARTAFNIYALHPVRTNKATAVRVCLCVRLIAKSYDLVDSTTKLQLQPTIPATSSTNRPCKKV
jgi:hypothetical protein